MPSQSWYTLSAKAVPTRYGLSKNMVMLLKAFDSYNTGSIDAYELGSLVRMSRNRRTAVTNTITKCAQMIKTNPEELKTCVDIIEMCTSILEISDRPPPNGGFPLMKLPTEIRDRVFELAIDSLFRTDCIVLSKKNTTCACPKLWPDTTQSPAVKALFAILGPQTSEEFFRVLFRKKLVRFRCPCEFDACLSENRFIRNSLRRVVVQWSGPRSDKAFQQLVDCSKLEFMKLVLTKGTLWHLNERETLIRRSFPTLLPRITDVLGLNELLKLRGLRQVSVTNYGGRGMNIYETDRAGLEKLLSDAMKQPREVW